MAEETDKPAEERPGPPRYRELSTWERVTAGIVGVGVIGGGFATLFLASNNGAVAVAVAFVAGAVLVVVAVQGTPLVKFGTKDVAAEWAGRQAVEQAKRIAVYSPSEAKDYLEGAAEANPVIRTDTEFFRLSEKFTDQALFAEEVRTAVLAAWAQPPLREMVLPPRVVGDDILLLGPHYRILVAAVSGDTKRDWTAVRRKANNVLATAVLVVSNRPFPYTRSSSLEERMQFIAVEGWQPSHGFGPVLDGLQQLVTALRQ